MIFPTWRYHRTEPACIVNDAAELDALGPGWTDNPGNFEELDRQATEQLANVTARLEAARIASEPKPEPDTKKPRRPRKD